MIWFLLTKRKSFFLQIKRKDAFLKMNYGKQTTKINCNEVLKTRCGWGWGDQNIFQNNREATTI